MGYRYNLMIKDIPAEDRPRERLIKLGPGALSNAELLAVILRIGTPYENVVSHAERILKYHDLKDLSRASTDRLKTISWVGDTKACQIAACFELGRRLEALDVEKKHVIESSEDVYHLIHPRVSGLKKELFIAIYLDIKNGVLREETVSVGGLNANVVHPREIFRSAVELSAASVILCHNHPSGDPKPSKDDIKITKRIVDAGNLMGIEVLDHIIVCDNEFVSLRESGKF